MTLQPTAEAQIASPRFTLAALIVISLWLIFIIILGRSGTFHVTADQPPLPTIMAMLTPPILFWVAIQVPSFRAEVLLINPVWLNGMQGLRILGAGFLFVASYGHLPQIFAFFAGWGDVLVAFCAPLVVAKVSTNRDFLASRRFLVFHMVGLLDFVGAVLSGLISRGTIALVDSPQSTGALASFPLLIIPCFAVPLWICLHIAALTQRRAYLDDMK